MLHLAFICVLRLLDTPSLLHRRRQEYSHRAQVSLPGDSKGGYFRQSECRKRRFSLPLKPAYSGPTSEPFPYSYKINRLMFNNERTICLADGFLFPCTPFFFVSFVLFRGLRFFI